MQGVGDSVGSMTPGMELIQRMARGDRQAFAPFFDRYAGLAYSLILRIVRDREEANDVLQEVFWEAWQAAGGYDPARGSPEAWLVTRARSRAIDRVRAVPWGGSEIGIRQQGLCSAYARASRSLARTSWAPLRDRARVTQRIERGAVVGEQPPEHLVRVLTGRGHWPHARGSLRELDRGAWEIHLPGDGVLHLHEHLALPEMRILRDFGDRAHGARGAAGLAADDLHEPRHRSPCAQDGLDGFLSVPSEPAIYSKSQSASDRGEWMVTPPSVLP